MKIWEKVRKEGIPKFRILWGEKGKERRGQIRIFGSRGMAKKMAKRESEGPQLVKEERGGKIRE